MVFDIGGYEGAWAKNINCKYGCKIHIFEPIKKYTEKIKLIFEQNENVFVHNFGLGNKNETVNFTVVNDGTTIYKEGQEKETCQMIDIFSFTEKEQIDEISLMKINIEGSEYDVLERIIESGLINRVNNIIVQFHDFVPDAQVKMERIREKLSKTHHSKFAYDFVWDHWKRN